MQNYKQDLLPTETYHVFSKAVGKEKLFITDANYIHFLNKIEYYILPIADIVSFSLMPNHFHLIVKFKETDSLKLSFSNLKGRPFNDNDDLSKFISIQIGHLLNSYTKYFNNLNNRKGALFLTGFKRSIVNYDSDFSAFIFYVHKNAVHHGYTTKIGLWKYDSFNAIISDEPTVLLRNLVLNWFGGKDAFIAFHHQNIELKNKPFDI